ncbi:hypothetical protein A9A89_0936 [Bifidobacterium psychraerophilum DSM 22366]|uniref:Anaerobic dehydrogenase n=2 Tax=Bifidobacterium psychraerophilum TaxID=218140 RepID=A0A087CI63_9BIFI|nr:anaerobic dehydrogenase [Bifidobacterium psychraerophilum]PKA94711.1 hypothetical protein A9A89_0936 [Bifidobacterium psychraerophilum DSM 22366]
MECQIWGGAANGILPVAEDGSIPEMYKAILPGSQIDDVKGIGHDLEMSLSDVVDPNYPREADRDQLAVGLLPYKPTEKQPLVEVVNLPKNDPWYGIYLACLGKLPEGINSDIIRAGSWQRDISFSDFVEIQNMTLTGSLDDLLSRMNPAKHTITPRQLSMVQLSYAATASTAIRSGRPVLPERWYARYDAGPNILVVCSPGSLDDVTLLWNLRSAHGDFYAVPIGIPYAEFSAEAVSKVISDPGLARNGISPNSLYITSCSVSTHDISEHLGGMSGVFVCSPDELLSFGTVLGWSREDVLVWKDGCASFKPLDPAPHRETLFQRNLNRLLIMRFDVAVEDSPLPASADYRVKSPNGIFYNGSYNSWSSLRDGERIRSVQWPSRGLIAKSLASIRGLRFRESAPGIAARILAEMIGDLNDLGMLCHAPLLRLLESMAARQGFNWYKERARREGHEVDPVESVGSSIDELTEKTFQDFKNVLGNSDKATRYWLAWAEKASVILKGFRIQCPECGAKQWLPIKSFTPPIICRGCSKTIDFPFGDEPIAKFQYRLSEQTRRVYEVDAIGHLLAARFFHWIFEVGSKGRLIGMHPGMSIFRSDGGNEIGEADLLMLTRMGEFVPIEVKRTAKGLNESEIQKLDILSGALKSSWSGVVVCQYARNVDETLSTSLVTRNSDGTYRRMALTYDQLLDPHPIWALGSDPFAIRKLTEEEITEREKEFVTSLKRRAEEPDAGWQAYLMLHRHPRSQSNSQNSSGA